jgi:hypothetical protein
MRKSPCACRAMPGPKWSTSSTAAERVAASHSTAGSHGNATPASSSHGRRVMPSAESGLRRPRPPARHAETG